MLPAVTLPTASGATAPLPTPSAPSRGSRLRAGAIAAAAALAMVAATAAPVHALDDDEEDFLRGVAATVAVGAVARGISRNAAPRYYGAPATGYYGNRTDSRYYGNGYGNGYGYGNEVYRPVPVYAPPAYSYSSAVAQGFAAYSPASKRAIQQRLRAYGYYRGPIDGIYGAGTEAAIQAYARDTGNARALASRNGTVSLLNGLLG